MSAFYPPKLCNIMIQSLFPHVVNQHVCSMPCVARSHQPHRQKLVPGYPSVPLDIAMFNVGCQEVVTPAYVHRLLERSEWRDRPEVLDAINSEKQGLLANGTWDESKIRPKSEVPAEARAKGQKIHFGALMVPVVPGRGGAEVALKIYIRPFSSIELACAVRQPSPFVRAFCESDVLFAHVTFEAPLRTSHFSLHSSHSTLHASHSTLHTSHCTLRTPHFTLHTSQSTLHTSHFTLHTSQSTLHSPHFTLHSSRPTLHTAHFISSELFSPYPSSSLLISSLLICHLSFHESLPSTSTKELDLDAKATKRRF